MFDHASSMICREKSQLDVTQWFIEIIIRSTCFRHYYAHHQELKTIQVVTACGTFVFVIPYVYLLYLKCIFVFYVYLLYLMCICCILCVFVVLLCVFVVSMCICWTLMCICCTMCVLIFLL